MMRGFGASAEELEKAEALMQKAQDAEVCDVWPENWPVLMFFLKVQMQWMRAGMDGRRVCLNWPGVQVVAGALGQRGKAWREMVEALLVIERAVLEADAEMQINKDK